VTALTPLRHAHQRAGRYTTLADVTPMLEAYTLLGALAARTRRVRGAARYR